MKKGKEIDVYKLDEISLVRDNEEANTFTASTDIMFDCKLSDKIVFNDVEFNKRDFKEIKKMIKERRGEMYYLYIVYFVNRKTLASDFRLTVAKTEASGVNKALKESKFSETDLDDLSYKVVELFEFEKEKKLKDAIDTIKKELG